MPLRAISTATHNTGTTVTIAVPVEASVGDIATLLVGRSNSTITSDLSEAGWTLHGDSAPTSSGGQLTIWSKTVTAPDIGADVTIAASSSARWAMAIMVHYGVTGFDTAPVFSTDGGPTTSPTAPSITTVTAGVELYSVYGVNVHVNGSGVIYTLPAGQTEITQLCSSNSTSLNSTLAIGTEILSSPGDSGSRAAATENTTLTDDRVRQGTASLAYAVVAAPQPAPTVQVRQGGSWVEKPLKARVGGAWL